jgi:hypothetical protein
MKKKSLTNNAIFNHYTLPLLFFIFVSLTSNAQIKIWSNYNVAIGSSTQAPTEKLNINGNFFCVPNGSLSGFYFTNYSGIAPGNEPMLKPQWNNTAWIGNANYQLHRVFASQVYTSTGQVQTSDRRLKTNIHAWSGSALSQIMNLNIYRYDMDVSKLNNIPEEKLPEIIEENKNKIGFIAQELKEEFPEMVSTIPGTEYYGVDYTMMIPVLLEAIKEQQQLILELQQKVESLESK